MGVKGKKGHCPSACRSVFLSVRTLIPAVFLFIHVFYRIGLEINIV